MINQLVRGTFKPKQIGSILYRRMEEKDYDQVAGIITKAFLAKEPIIRGGQFTEAEMVEYFKLFKPHFIQNNVSTVAQDTTKNVIIGGILADDYHSSVAEVHLKKLSERWMLLYIWLENIKHQLLADKLIPKGKGKICHFFLGAVQQEYTNQGVFKQSLLVNQELAWKLGFDYNLSEVSSPVTQHIFGLQGYSTIYFKTYDNFQKVMGNQEINLSVMGEHFRDQPSGLKVMMKQWSSEDFKEE